MSDSLSDGTMDMEQRGWPVPARYEPTYQPTGPLPAPDDLQQRIDDLEQMVIDLSEVCIDVFNQLSHSYHISSRPSVFIREAQLRITRWGRHIRRVRTPREWPKEPS